MPPTLVHPLIGKIFKKAIFDVGLRRSTLHHEFLTLFVRENVLALHAAFALPSTAREAKPPANVDDCFVGLPFAILPVGSMKNLVDLVDKSAFNSYYYQCK